MAEQFKDQGGAATMDPSPIFRRIMSKVVTHTHSEVRLVSRRRKAESARQRSGRAHVVEYFHQVADGYSHLASQVLEQFAARYSVELKCHIVRGPEGNNAPDAELLLALSRYDAGLIAPQYGTDFPTGAQTPAQSLIDLASSILAASAHNLMPGLVSAVSQALWADDLGALRALAEEHGEADTHATQAALDTGTQRRTVLKHYSGGMFYYEGEWYWGVDRLHYLESRLAALGVDSEPNEPAVAPCPVVDLGDVENAGALTLEFFPSLRSPYTSIVFDETVALAAQSGVTFRLRPVLPMVMRGVPATREKGTYIFSDTAREARRRGVPYGNFFDPIGEPVRRCYSLYPWADSQGKGADLLSSFLRHAFSMGVNTNASRGLRRVVESAGLSWHEAKEHMGDSAWEGLLEANRLSMYDGGLWGVPSYRLIDANGDVQLEIWGQDRLWLVAQEIRRHHRSQ